MNNRNKKASYDSEEDGAQIMSSQGSQPQAGASAGFNGDQQAPAVSTGAGDGDTKLNGHHDPKQRSIYLALLSFSVFNALLGLAMLVVWIFKYRPTTGISLTTSAGLSNLHPLLMYLFMVSLNMYSILIYRTHYAQRKQLLKWAHAIVSGANIVMSLLGVAAMYKSHLMSNYANFYSLHSWIGVLTNAFYLSQFLVGLIAFLRPGLSQQRRAALMPWHRLAGAMLLVLAATSAITGIVELVIFQDKNGAYSGFTAITFIANFAGVSIVLLTATSIYLVTAPQYLRPNLPEEQPLKR